MIKGLHHTGLSVTNLESAIAYFSAANSFEKVWAFDVPDTNDSRRLLGTDTPCGKAALLKGPTGYLELFQFDAAAAQASRKRGVHEAGIRHICLQHADADELFDAYVEAGSSWHARPSGLGTGALYCYIRDPEGNVIELEGVPWAEPGDITPWYAHTAIVTADIQRLAGFYEMLTGVDVHRRGSFGPHEKFDTVAGVDGVEFQGAWIRLANGEIEMWEYGAPRTVAAEEPRSVTDLGWNHICFEVDNLEAEYQRLGEHGVELHGPPLSVGRVKILYGRDPDGNIFELLEPNPGQESLSIDALEGRAFLEELKEAFAKNYKSA